MEQIFDKIKNVVEDADIEGDTSDMKLIKDIFQEYDLNFLNNGVRYHTWLHIRAMLSIALDAHTRGKVKLTPELFWAILGHDIVYDTTVPNQICVERSIKRLNELVTCHKMKNYVNMGAVTIAINATATPFDIIGGSVTAYPNDVLPLHDLDFAYFVDGKYCKHGESVNRIRQEHNISDEYFMASRLEFLLNLQGCIENALDIDGIKSVFRTDIFTNAERKLSNKNIETEITCYRNNIKFWEEV